VFMHAENDTTMPWVETESLFKSTLQAAIEGASPHDGIPKDLKVVDLGEAGRQEVWQCGTRCIQKTIAKHGGKRVCSQHPASGYRSAPRSGTASVAQRRLDAFPFLLTLTISKCGLLHEAFQPHVSALKTDAIAVRTRHSGVTNPVLSMLSLTWMPRQPVASQFQANAARPQWNDAICATCPYNSATFRPRGANDRLVVAWYVGLGT
jgi:hypothetical protein